MTAKNTATARPPAPVALLDLLTYREAGALMNVTVKTVRKLARSGRLPVYRFSERNLRVRRGDVLALIERCRVAI